MDVTPTETVEHTEVAHGSSGMPQLDLATYPSQLFWLAVTFIALYVLLSRSALPKIAHVLETRQARIDADLAKATQLKDEAQSARDAYEKALADARTKSQSMLSEMQASLAKSAAERQAELDAGHAATFAEAESKIASARGQALATLTPVAVELAGMIVEKLANIRVSQDEIKRVVERTNTSEQEA